MTSPGVNPDIEAHTGDPMEAQPSIDEVPLPRSTPNTPPLTNADAQRQVTDTNGHHNRNTPALQFGADYSGVHWDRKHGDSSDGLWSMYLTEAEKQDMQITENWKEYTDGVLVFTGLFSATIAAFIIESYKLLSPDTGDITNTLLAQISVQLVNISNGIPLANVVAQSRQPFKPTASAVRVNVLWFTSLILVLICALLATTMQHWSRWYRQLAQHRGPVHRRGLIRAFMFEGILKFGMSRAFATMLTLMHVSVFLFFAGLVEFLFPIYTPVAYATLSCITVFALAYANLTVLPNIYPNCPYSTPLSGFTWRISQFSMLVFLWIALKSEGLFRRLLSNLRSLANQHAPEPYSSTRRTWRGGLKSQIGMRRQWLSQSLWRTIELSAYRTDPIVVTSALEWTFTVLNQDQEIEDFVARVPGFFDSRVVPDATSAVLRLIDDQPNPIFASRLYDLLNTCISETSILDDRRRKNRLRICMRCLWYFGRAYNQSGSYWTLPSYFSLTLASPEVTRLVRAEEDSAIRVLGRCFGALVANKLAADRESISQEELACLSAILGTESREVVSLLGQPGAIKLANIVSLTSVDGDSLVGGAMPSDVLDIFEETLRILSQTLLTADQTDLSLPENLVARFREIYSQAPNWLKDELQHISDRLQSSSSHA
ncbi:hypothetical protein H4582DRAFT_1894842 [Lactarius indigo]|nr:hypothetical protein H4582DRAFT_1894842 [Lactarius indigo]